MLPRLDLLGPLFLPNPSFQVFHIIFFCALLSILLLEEAAHAKSIWDQLP